MHSAHGDIHEIGLQDNCEACEDHAQKPWNTLDRQMLENLIRRNYFYRFGEDFTVGEGGERNPRDRFDYAPRSTNEAIAMAEITNLMERMGKLMKCDPQNLIQHYLEKKWGIEFV